MGVVFGVIMAKDFWDKNKHKLTIIANDKEEWENETSELIDEEASQIMWDLNFNPEDDYGAFLPIGGEPLVKEEVIKKLTEVGFTYSKEFEEYHQKWEDGEEDD